MRRFIIIIPFLLFEDRQQLIFQDLVKLMSASGPTSCLFIIGNLMINEPKIFEFPSTR